jgi:hypothetical protein
MGDIRMTGEIRTDYDCESTGMPAERWAEAEIRACPSAFKVRYAT